MKENKTAKLIRWVTEHPEVKWDLSGIEMGGDSEECLNIIDILEQAGFYELIFIILIGGEKFREVGFAMDKMFYIMWAEKWEEIGDQNMCTWIKEEIKSELEKRKSGEEAE